MWNRAQDPSAALHDPNANRNKLTRFSFYEGTRHNAIESMRAGRPIFDDVDMMVIKWLNNTKNTLHVPVTDHSDRPVYDMEDNRKFYPIWKDHPDVKPLYDAWKAGREATISGTPLDVLPFITAAKKKELDAFGIKTAEELVALDPQTMSKLGMGANNLRQRTQEYLDRSEGAAVEDGLRRELDEMRAELAMMRVGQSPAEQVNAMTAPSGEAAAADGEPSDAEKVFSSETWDEDSLRLWIMDGAKSIGLGAERKYSEKTLALCNKATLAKKAAEVSDAIKAKNEGSPQEAAA